ncbi:ABC transporter ATP-binding protein [Deinococcus peraridilitoris]|uniref:ABC-type branched-chain amino acid transport systems, ATPase component n=1 Tax=Deinococcus peraridilitoris (strain DSM 19664 / LMG 22246 / CIP 109416 / KR-200) TaxID=937777 RepID=L0A0B7_DEIPD|nr:ABC transporter ATP-binding protein [Deinococcus peraridilitoris]AFZ66460.1 ABC-type branched-chain amino acid transport systems, ATPase component [Deinococcus peraridilitoris DSM 19664]
MSAEHSGPQHGAVLQVHDLHVNYGKVEALHGVSLQVEAGQIVTVIGPNGAGKTTLLSAIQGVLPLRGGHVAYHGESLAAISLEARVGRGMVLVPERRELFSSMNVEDNLTLGAYARYRRGERRFAADLDRVYDRFPRLRERRRQLAGTLSGGEQQMLAIGRALMAKPKLLMLDEPSLGLAPIIVREIFQILESLRAEGVTMLLVEQNARAALQVSNYAYVLETGEVSLQGPAGELAQNEAVAASYLGTRR